MSSLIDELTLYEHDAIGQLLRVAIRAGAITPGGLNTGGRVTEVTLTTASWTKLERSGTTNPSGSGPLSDRNALGIQNLSGQSIKVAYAESATLNNLVGITIPDGGQRYYDVKDTIDIYAKAISGTPTITIEEIA